MATMTKRQEVGTQDLARSSTNGGLPNLGARPVSTYSQAWGNSSTNIWGHSAAAGGFVSNALTRERSLARPRDKTEAKTGSAALIESSFSDDWNGQAQLSSQSKKFRSTLPLPPPASFGGQHNVGSASLNFHGNGHGHGNGYGNGQNPNTTAANFTGSATYKANENAPAVYTKLGRPSQGDFSRPADSPRGSWADAVMTHSPTEERKNSMGGTVSSQSSSATSWSNSTLVPRKVEDFPQSSRMREIGPFGRPPADALALHARNLQPAEGLADRFESRPNQNLAPLDCLTLNNRARSTPTNYSGRHYNNTGAGSSGRRYDADYDEEISRPNFNPNSFSQPYEEYYKAPQYDERPFANGRQDSFLGAAVPAQGSFSPARSMQDPSLYQDAMKAQSAAWLDPRYRAFQEQANLADPQFAQMFANQLRAQYYHYYGYPAPNGAQYYGVPPQLPLPQMSLGPTMHPPRGPREIENGDDIRSALLEAYKNNTKANRRFELRDIYDHVVEFSGDQHGSRFIQQKLETANSDEKERIFREILPNAIQLMTDVFGNYVIQKLFEHGDQNQKKLLAGKMKGHVLVLSQQMYGCRVVQKALDHILTDQQALLVRELEHNVLKCVKDQNGNHVIQKAIERCPPPSIRFIFNAFHGQIQSLSVHPYGCRVIQRCLEHCDPHDKHVILLELHECMAGLIVDQYGNYVVQHVVQHGDEKDRASVLSIISSSLEQYSKHKFASNVVERCLNFADDSWRRSVVNAIIVGNRREGEDTMIGLIRDQYGNYVIQKLLDVISRQDYMHFMDHLQPEISRAKRGGSGKQVISIEKKMHRFGPHSYQPMHVSGPYASHNVSTTPTPPPLMADTQSLQTSSLPSINGDAVEGATASRKGSDPSSERSLY